MLANLSPNSRAAITMTASRLGISPADLAAVMAYETVGTMNPDIRGGAGNAYRGLIQFGPAERKAYGYQPGMTAADQIAGPVYNYLADRGVKPGMGLLDIYSTINAGSPGHPGARDASGKTVAQHVAAIKANYLPDAMAYFGSAATSPAMDAANAEAVGQPMHQGPLGMGRGRTHSGSAVSQLQQQLAAAGFNPGKVDGSFGPRTTAALKAYQSANNLEPDGVAGPQTFARLGGGAATEDIASAGRLANPLTQGVSPGGTLAQEVSPTDYALRGQPDFAGLAPAAAAGGPALGPVGLGPIGRGGLPPTADAGTDEAYSSHANVPVMPGMGPIKPGPYGADAILKAQLAGDPAAVAKANADIRANVIAKEGMFGAWQKQDTIKKQITDYLKQAVTSDPVLGQAVQKNIAANPALLGDATPEVAADTRKTLASVPPITPTGEMPLPDVRPVRGQLALGSMGAPPPTGIGMRPPVVPRGGPVLAGSVASQLGWDQGEVAPAGYGNMGGAPSQPDSVAAQLGWNQGDLAAAGYGNMGAAPQTAAAPPSGEAAMWNAWSKSPQGASLATAYDQALQKRNLETQGPGFPSAWGEQPQETPPFTGQSTDEATNALLQRGLPGGSSDALANWQREQLANAMAARNGSADLPADVPRGNIVPSEPDVASETGIRGLWDSEMRGLGMMGDAIGSGASAAWGGLNSGLDSTRSWLAGQGLIDPANATEAPPGPQSYYTPPTGRISGLTKTADASGRWPMVSMDRSRQAAVDASAAAPPPMSEADLARQNYGWQPNAAYDSDMGFVSGMGHAGSFTPAFYNRDHVSSNIEDRTLAGGADARGSIASEVPTSQPWDRADIMGPTIPPMGITGGGMLNHQGGLVDMPDRFGAPGGFPVDVASNGSSDDFLRGSGKSDNLISGFSGGMPPETGGLYSPTPKAQQLSELPTYNPPRGFGTGVMGYFGASPNNAKDASAPSAAGWGEGADATADAGAPKAFVMTAASPDNSISGETFLTDNSLPAVSGSFTDSAPAVTLPSTMGKTGLAGGAPQLAKIISNMPKPSVAKADALGRIGGGGGGSFPTLGIPNIGDVIKAATGAGYSTTPTGMLGSLASRGFSMPNFSTGSGGSVFATNRNLGGTTTDVHGNTVNVGTYYDSNGNKQTYTWSPSGAA